MVDLVQAFFHTKEALLYMVNLLQAFMDRLSPGFFACSGGAFHQMCEISFAKKDLKVIFQFEYPTSKCPEWWVKIFVERKVNHAIHHIYQQNTLISFPSKNGKTRVAFEHDIVGDLLSIDGFAEPATSTPIPAAIARFGKEVVGPFLDRLNEAFPGFELFETTMHSGKLQIVAVNRTDDHYSCVFDVDLSVVPFTMDMKLLRDGKVKWFENKVEWVASPHGRILFPKLSGLDLSQFQTEKPKPQCAPSALRLNKCPNCGGSIELFDAIDSPRASFIYRCRGCCGRKYEIKEV